MNQQTEKLVAKIYEQTHVKIEEDDPVLSLFLAQQVLMDELSNDLSDIQEEQYEKVQKMYQIAFDKSALLTSEMAEKIENSIESSLKAISQQKDKARTQEYSSLSKKISNLSMMVYLFILVNLFVIGEVIFILKH